jgi:rfaE bifunctional protein kinase chain/domain
MAVNSPILLSLSKIPNLRALVVGDVMLDTYEFCYTSKSKPINSEKPGKRAYEAIDPIEVLGGAGNVAVNLASWGVHTYLVGLTGNDEKYFKLRELATRSGIDPFLIRDRSRPTTSKARIYLDDEYLLRRDSESSHKVDAETSAKLVNEVLRIIPNTDFVILSDYNKGVFTEADGQIIIKECKLNSVPVIVDFKPDNRTAFVGADVIAPNETEAAIIKPGFSIESLEPGCRSLHELLRCRNTVVTLGEAGLCGYGEDGFIYIPANRVTEVDGVGCGDTVRAGLAVGIALGLSLRESMELANDAAAVIIQKPATASCSLDEITQFISKKYELITQ